MKLLNISGNIGALSKWLNKFDDVSLIERSEISKIGSGQCLVLPGGNVGSIPSADMKHDILEAFNRGVKLFAICGAFQALFDDTAEVVSFNNLGLYAGTATKLSKPKIGFTMIQGTWYSGAVYNNCMYNVTSDQLDKELSENFILSSDGFIYAVKTDKLLGVQFHPELSNGNFDLTFKCWLDAK